MIVPYSSGRRLRRSLAIGTSTIVIVYLTWSNFDVILNGDLKLSTMNQRLYFNDTTDDVTLVTAFFDLGTLRRHNEGEYRSNQTYFEWAKIYQHVENPLVCYTDDVIFVRHMMLLRKGKEHKTKIFRINRNSTWAFQREPRVKEILSQPGYPRYHPNTGTSGYSCVQFAKYDVVVRAAKANYFNTKYFAWVDIGQFRDRTSGRNFELNKLDSHNESCVAMSKVYNESFTTTPKEIFYNHMTWVGGAFAFGTREKMIQFAYQFKRVVDYYLSINLVNTDEQVLYAMFSDQGRKEVHPDVEIQYNQAEGWFGLGTKMIHELNDTSNDENGVGRKFEDNQK